MTKAQDQISLDASKAAQLVKNTAEQTATALNIQYIQKDIAEMRADIKTLTANQDGKLEQMQKQYEQDIKDLHSRIDSLSKTVNMGLGAAVVISAIMPFVYKMIFK